MKLRIIIPTYNEKENISKIIELTKSIFIENSIQGGIIVVDDNSPDGTAEIVKNLADKINDKNFELTLIKRAGKLGMGTAYIEGFKKALSMDTNYIMEMDADFSHDPHYIPTFIENLQKYDIVIGSRYVKNGGVKNWSKVRQFISRSGSIYSKLILWWNIKDATSGFVAYRKKVLEDINLDRIKSNGYSFQVEMKYRAHQLGFKLKEIPIIFVDRVEGVSKMNGSIVKEAIKKVIYLRFSK